MSYPSLGGSASATAAAGSSRTSGQTVSGQLVPVLGDSVYVIVAYGSGVFPNSRFVSGVTDTSSNTYRKAGGLGYAGGTYPTLEIWYADNVPANSTLQVTVTFNQSAVFAFYAVIVHGGSAFGSLDVKSGGATGSGTSSSDPLTSVGPN